MDSTGLLTLIVFLGLALFCLDLFKKINNLQFFASCFILGIMIFIINLINIDSHDIWWGIIGIFIALVSSLAIFLLIKPAVLLFIDYDLESLSQVRQEAIKEMFNVVINYQPRMDNAEIFFKSKRYHNILKKVIPIIHQDNNYYCNQDDDTIYRKLNEVKILTIKWKDIQRFII